jgi:hypothetical protein
MPCILLDGLQLGLEHRDLFTQHGYLCLLVVDLCPVPL